MGMNLSTSVPLAFSIGGGSLALIGGIMLIRRSTRATCDISLAAGSVRVPRTVAWRDSS
jgi:hypothetical protein